MSPKGRANRNYIGFRVSRYVAIGIRGAGRALVRWRQPLGDARLGCAQRITARREVVMRAARTLGISSNGAFVVVKVLVTTCV